MAQSVEIIVKEKEGSTEINFPWLPDEISYKSGGVQFSTYKLLNFREAARPSSVGLAEVSWEGIFPGEARRDHPFCTGKWKSPSTYQAILNKWKNKKRLLKITVTGTPVSMYCYLKDFECTWSGGAGDCHYKVGFLEYRNISVTVKKAKTKSKSKFSEKNRLGGKLTAKRPASLAPSTFVVKTGDSLWSIAKQLLGTGDRWKEIYSLNKSAIEEAAKKHGVKNGYEVFAGTKLKLPKK